MANYTGWQSPGYSNPNLLKNWDFRQVVNQRGQSEYTKWERCIDMWIVSFDNTALLRVSNGYIEMVRTNTGTWFNFWETPENRLTEGTYTLSFLVDDYTKVNQVYAANNDIYRSNFEFKNNLCTHTFTLGKNEYVKDFGIQMKEEVGSLKLYAAKLEVGTVSTLALDLMQPPNYPAQLRECQRYLQVLTGNGYSNAVGMAHAYSDTGAYTTIDLEQEMRIRPTIIGMENLKIYKAAYAASDSVHVINADYNIAGKKISGNFTYSEPLEVGKEYQVFLDSNSKLLLSSEL